MFDLFRSRDKAVRLLLGGLLVIVAFSMLVYLIPGAGMPTTNNSDQIVAEIGKDVVTIQDIDRDLQNKISGRQIPPDVVGVLIPQEIEQMIADRATAYQAQQMGLQVSDEELANTIRSLPNVAGLTPDQYRDFLAQQGFSVQQFEGNLRKQVLITNLVNLAVADGVVVTPAEIEQEYRHSFEKVKLEYVGFSSEKLKSEIKPAADDLKKYYQTHQGMFNIPEARSFQLLVADPMKMSEALQVSDAQIQQYYDAHKDSYRTPERVKARHILFKTTNQSDADIQKTKAKAADVLKQIKGGADFAKLAEKYSEDPGSAKNGGDLGWVVRGQTVKNFETTAFTLKPNEISDLVSTEYGFHIIQVLEKQDARLQPLDSVLKPVIAAAVKGQMVNDKMQTIADQARAELVKAPQSAKEIAGKYGLQFVAVDNHKPGEAIPGLGVDAALDPTVQSLKKGGVSEVTQSGSRLEIAAVTDVIPSRPAEFATVEAQVRNLQLQDAAIRLANDKARQAAEMLKANGGDVQAAAKKLGGDAKTTDQFTRGGAAEGLGSAAQLSEAFDKPVGGIIGPLTVAGQVIVGKVVEKVDPNLSQLPQQRDIILQQLKSKKAQERAELFQDSVVSKLSQEGKIKVHKDVMNRLIARYRS